MDPLEMHKRILHQTETFTEYLYMMYSAAPLRKKKKEEEKPLNARIRFHLRALPGVVLFLWMDTEIPFPLSIQDGADSSTADSTDGYETPKVRRRSDSLNAVVAQDHSVGALADGNSYTHALNLKRIHPILS